VIKNQEHKFFIPYTTIFQPEGLTPEQIKDSKRHHVIHGCVTEIGKRTLKYVPLSDEGKPIVPVTPPADIAAKVEEDCGMGAACCKELSWEESEKAERTLHYDYMIYALGSHLPAPINIWSTVDHNADIKMRVPITDLRLCSNVDFPSVTYLQAARAARNEGEHGSRLRSSVSRKLGVLRSSVAERWEFVSRTRIVDSNRS
jgi:hypothetical protein